MPTRAIPRERTSKGHCTRPRTQAVLWLLGPAEDGYGTQLELLSTTNSEVRRGLPEERPFTTPTRPAIWWWCPPRGRDSAIPVLESVTHRRPLAVYPYPVLLEIEHSDLNFFHLDDVTRIVEYLRNPDEGLLERNLLIAREHFNVATLPSRLSQLLIPDESDVRESVTTIRHT
jgi:hypothetical protein